MNLLKTGSILRRLLIIAPVVVGLIWVSLFMPAQRLSIEGIGMLSFETTVTLSVGYEVASAAPDILPLLPSGDGDYTGINDVEPTGTAHYLVVDDPVLSPDDLTTYVSTTSGTQQKDAYTLPNPSLTGTINSVKVYFRAGGINDKPHDYQPFLRLGEVETSGTVQTHSLAAFTTYNQILARPGGGNWTWTDINDLQVAIGLMDTGPGNPVCTQVYVEVDYTPAVEPVITVDPTNYDFDVVEESSTPSTITTYFAIDNDSTMQTDQTIGVTTSTWEGGIPWDHAEDAVPGPDLAGLKANRGGTWGTGDIIVKYISPNYIYENCPANTDYSFGLKLWTPTSFSDGVEKQIIVRITAVAG
ncbi:hypothetical protein ES703_110511 [subsurface metagenome]